MCIFFFRGDFQDERLMKVVLNSVILTDTHLEGKRPSLSLRRPLHHPSSPFSITVTSSLTLTLSSSSSLAVCGSIIVTASLPNI